MKRMKKLLALALAGLMLAAALTGCGSSSSDDTIRANAIADIFSAWGTWGQDITCKADPGLTRAAQEFAKETEAYGGKVPFEELAFGTWEKRNDAADFMYEALVRAGLTDSTAADGIIIFAGIDHGSDDPVKQAIDIMMEGCPVRYNANGSYSENARVGFGRWQTEDGLKLIFALVVIEAQK